MSNYEKNPIEKEWFRLADEIQKFSDRHGGAAALDLCADMHNKIARDMGDEMPYEVRAAYELGKEITGESPVL